jgi:hypothetical protein
MYDELTPLFATGTVATENNTMGDEGGRIIQLNVADNHCGGYTEAGQ